MNNLSLLIYAADMVDNAKNILTAGMIIGSIGVPAVWIAAAFAYDFHDIDRDEMRKIRSKWKVSAILAVVSAIIWVPIPSKQTILMISASEIGESVLMSTEAQKIGGEAGAIATDSLRVLRKFINEQLDEESK